MSHSTTTPSTPTTTNTEPRRPGRPRKEAIPSQLPANVIRFDSRPRFMVGDAVEFVGESSNRGRLAVILQVYGNGDVQVRAMGEPIVMARGDKAMVAITEAENLYRSPYRMTRH